MCVVTFQNFIIVSVHVASQWNISVTTLSGKSRPMTAKEAKKEREKQEEHERYKKDNHTLTLQVKAVLPAWRVL